MARGFRCLDLAAGPTAFVCKSASPLPTVTLTLGYVYRKTPSAVPHPYRSPHFYYRPREMAPGDVDDPRSRTPVQTESAAAHSHPPPDDPAARMRSPLDYLRKRFRQRPGSGSSIPNIIVESPVSIPVLAHAPHSQGSSSAHVRGHAVRTRDDHVASDDFGATRAIEP